MSDYKREMVIAVVLAVILVASLALVSSYFFQQTQPIPPPLPSPTPVPAPTPTPHPAPPPEFAIKTGLEPAEGALGFNYTPMESQGSVSKILVLPPGGSGTIPVTLVSKSDKDYAVTLYIEPEGLGDARLFRGIRFTFTPTSMFLRAGGTEGSLLKIEVDPDAPTGFYGPSVGGRTEEFSLSGGESYFNLLILPYTPSYAFYIYAQPPGPAPLPTPAPTPLPAAPPPDFVLSLNSSEFTIAESARLLPELVIPKGQSATVSVTVEGQPYMEGRATISFSVTYGAASDPPILPPGVIASFQPPSVDVEANSTSVAKLTFQVSADAPDGTYLMTVGTPQKISTGFYLTVGSGSEDIILPEGETPPTPVPPPPPTPTPTQPPAPPPPTIEVKAGGKVHVMFGIQTFSDDPNLPIQFNYTYNSKPAGSLPSGVSANMVSNPLQVVRVPIEERFYLLTLSASSDAPEGTYEIVVTGSVGSYAFERSFYLVVKGS